MNLQLMMRDARPAGGVWDLAYARNTLMAPRSALGHRPILIRAGGDAESARLFYLFADTAPWGSVIVFADLTAVARLGVIATAERAEWREWNPPGREPHETVFVRSHWDGNTYGSHRPYLAEAVRLTDSAVLELGCGDSSTQMLHDAVAEKNRLLVSIESDADWIVKFESTMKHPLHIFDRRDDPATFLIDFPSRQWSVVFVDHAPGETRRAAIERARTKAEYICVHDVEDVGYDVWDTLESFEYKRIFRYARPWTAVVSMTREIFADPLGKEL